jgi:uncharacterized protein YjbI with pentapeptide repeats
LFLLGLHLRQLALRENPQFAALRRWTLWFAAWAGTDLRDSILTNTDLRGVDLRFTRFAHPGDLTRTRFRGAKNAHLAHVKGTILADRRVRELLVTADGAGGDYKQANLHGAWLVGANLRGASLTDAVLTGADLSGADLSDADLSRATLIGADLTGATLTGACIDGWNINTATKLDGVKAEYVYLRSGASGERFERRPQGEGVFGPNDFATLFEQALETVDLIFHEGIDWNAFRAALDELRRHHAEHGRTEDKVFVRSIDNTDDGRLIVRIAVPENADKDADYRRMMVDYERNLMRITAERDQLAGRLEHKDELLGEVRRHNATLERMIDATRHQPITVQAIAQNAPEAAPVSTGDTFNLSGNITGSNINIKSRLEQVSQTIGALPGTDDESKAELKRLLHELSARLGEVPPEHAAEADAVATLTGELIQKASDEPRNPALLQASASALLTAAGRLAERVKPVLALVQQVLAILGLP